MWSKIPFAFLLWAGSLCIRPRISPHSRMWYSRSSSEPVEEKLNMGTQAGKSEHLMTHICWWSGRDALFPLRTVHRGRTGQERAHLVLGTGAGRPGRKVIIFHPRFNKSQLLFKENVTFSDNQLFLEFLCHQQSERRRKTLNSTKSLTRKVRKSCLLRTQRKSDFSEIVPTTQKQLTAGWRGGSGVSNWGVMRVRGSCFTRSLSNALQKRDVKSRS